MQSGGCGAPCAATQGHDALLSVACMPLPIGAVDLNAGRLCRNPSGDHESRQSHKSIQANCALPALQSCHCLGMTNGLGTNLTSMSFT